MVGFAPMRPMMPMIMPPIGSAGWAALPPLMAFVFFIICIFLFCVIFKIQYETMKMQDETMRMLGGKFEPLVDFSVLAGCLIFPATGLICWGFLHLNGLGVPAILLGAYGTWRLLTEDDGS